MARERDDIIKQSGHKFESGSSMYATAFAGKKPSAAVKKIRKAAMNDVLKKKTAQ